MSSKIKLVVSDLHIGSGVLHEDGSTNIFEDFKADTAWKEFLEYYTTGEFASSEVELILNGDIVNSLQVGYEGFFSPIITEKMAVEKVQKIIEGHPLFFDSLKEFSQKKKHQITYIIGNHDIDVFWDGVKDLLEERIDNQINFVHFEYQKDGVHYEHGQQFEEVNKTDPKKLFITKGLREPILNLPWGSHFVLNFIVPMKKQRPAIDKVRPLSNFVKWSFFNDFLWTLKTIIKALLYFFATRFSKSIYRTNQVGTTFKIMKDLLFRPKLSRGAKKILQDNEHIHAVVMGHTHNALYMRFNDGKVYLNTGTWTEATSLRLETLGKHTLYTYAFIDYRNAQDPHKPTVTLKEWKGNWHQHENYSGY